VWPTWWALFLPSWRPLLTSSSPTLVFPENITWQKIWVRLTSGRSLEVKNMQKQEYLLRSVKTK
jgi:hypothetical protein